ncbi:hypothetical protein MNV49_002243 [Pseudohyphozyma bogoriensis]|nr:hypothetical protein MNV49_002243 [Pseudohyphozyma bogoriensis]
MSAPSCVYPSSPSPPFEHSAHLSAPATPVCPTPQQQQYYPSPDQPYHFHSAGGYIDEPSYSLQPSPSPSLHYPSPSQPAAHHLVPSSAAAAAPPTPSQPYDFLAQADTGFVYDDYLTADVPQAAMTTVEFLEDSLARAAAAASSSSASAMGTEAHEPFSSHHTLTPPPEHALSHPHHHHHQPVQLRDAPPKFERRNSTGYLCPTCPWTTPFVDHMELHYQAHLEGGMFECLVDGCHELYRRCDDFVRHSKLAHGLGTPAAGGILSKKRSHSDGSDSALEYHHQTYSHPPTPKRICSEGQAPITPDPTPYYSPPPRVHGQPRSTSMVVSRTLSYGGPPHPPPIPRSMSYSGHPSSSFSFAEQDSSADTFVLRTHEFDESEQQYFSPIPNDPHGHLLASPVSLSVSQSRFQPHVYHSHAHSTASSSPSPEHSPHSNSSHPSYSPHGSTPASPHFNATAFVPLSATAQSRPHSRSQPQQPSSSHRHSRRSSSFSTQSLSYIDSQTALSTAAGMNRLLSRLPAIVQDEHSQPPLPRHPPTAFYHSTSTMEAVHPKYRQPAPTEASDKTHFCTIGDCDKAFKRLEHLKRHERTHTDDKPFGCDWEGCGKFFSRSDNLTQHRKTHENKGSRARKPPSP